MPSKPRGKDPGATRPDPSQSVRPPRALSPASQEAPIPTPGGGEFRAAASLLALLQRVQAVESVVFGKDAAIDNLERQLARAQLQLEDMGAELEAARATDEEKLVQSNQSLALVIEQRNALSVALEEREQALTDVTAQLEAANAKVNELTGIVARFESDAFNTK